MLIIVLTEVLSVKLWIGVTKCSLEKQRVSTCTSTYIDSASRDQSSLTNVCVCARAHSWQDLEMTHEIEEQTQIFVCHIGQPG